MTQLRILLAMVALGLAGAGSAAAQALDVDRWLAPRLGPSSPSIRYSLDIYPTADIKDQSTNLRFLEHRLGVQIPVWQTQDREVSLSFRGGLQNIDSGAVLPVSQTPLPGELWDLRLGAGYRHIWGPNRLWGVFASFGSASDRPFSRGDTLEGTAAAYLRLPQGDRDAWLFFLYFSSNREFLNWVPLPGVGYWWEPNKTFQATIGIPFAAFTWKPLDGLSLKANYFPLRNVQAEIAYRLLTPLTIFSEFQWRNLSYFRAGRDSYYDRIFYYEKRLRGGLRLDLASQVSLTVSGGYAFDRMFFEGRRYQDRGANLIEVGNGPFASAMLTLTP